MSIETINTSIEQNDTIIKWKDELYAIGIPEIDMQHKVIVFHINNLYRGIKQSIDKSDLTMLFNALFDYTKYHFESEEKYFSNLNENDAALHKLQHKHFLEQLQIFKSKDNTVTITAQELLDFLLDWLAEHIVVEDKKLFNLNAVQEELNSVQEELNSVQKVE